MTEKVDLIKTIASATKMRLDMLPAELKWMGAGTAEQWRRIAEALEKGEPICWDSYCSSPEIFYAMDLPAIMQEGLGAASVGLPGKLNEKYIDIAHENLVAEHVCSTQKVMIGAALCGDLPLPTAIAYVAQPCDSTMVTYTVLAERLGIPIFTLDMPPGKDERAVQYVADEIERMVAFLEKHTGKKLEYDKLREMMEYSNIACDYNLKINELSKMVPSPVPSPMGGGLVSVAGTPEGAEFYEKLYERTKTVVESGEGYPPDQRIRVGWFSTGVAYDPQLTNWMHQEFGTITVSSLLGTFTAPPAQDISSMRKIIEALALKQMDTPMHRECGGSLDAWLDYAIPTCRDWKIDVVIMTAHIGCKNVWAVHKLFKDKIADELGIPTLIVEADFCDGRPFPAEGIKAQISDFFNTVVV